MADVPLSFLVGALIVLMVMSAFFSGSETALMSLNRYRLKHLAEQGHKGARRAQALLDQPDRLIGLILIGNNFVNILATQLATYIGYRIHGDLGIAIATGLLTLVLLVFSEVMPKTYGALRSETVAFPAAFVYGPLMRLAWPFVWLINLAANNVLRLFGLHVNQTGSHALNREELRSVLTQGGSLLPKRHRNMLLGILDLEYITVEDIMIPRNEITGIDLEDEWEEILDQLTHAPYTRLPAFRGSIDQIVGFLHMRKIMPLILDQRLTRVALEHALRAPHYIPKGTPLNRVLLNFQRERRRIGLVIDEYGDIQGMATLEDVLEEIVGEFTTDPSELARDIQAEPDGSYLIDGSMHVRELNRLLGWELNTSGPRTLNGLILERLEMIPPSGTSILIDGHPVEVLQTQSNAVKTARVGKRLANYEAEV